MSEQDKGPTVAELVKRMLSWSIVPEYYDSAEQHAWVEATRYWGSTLEAVLARSDKPVGYVDPDDLEDLRELERADLWAEPNPGHDSIPLYTRPCDSECVWTEVEMSGSLDTIYKRACDERLTTTFGHDSYCGGCGANIKWDG